MSEKKGGKKVKSEAPGYIYQVTKQGKSKSMRISEEYYHTPTIYYNLRKRPRGTILHEMIGTAAKCWEEKHDKQLKELRAWKNKTEDYELMVMIVELYKQKYGPLCVIRRNQRETQ